MKRVVRPLVILILATALTGSAFAQMAGGGPPSLSAADASGFTVPGHDGRPDGHDADDAHDAGLHADDAADDGAEASTGPAARQALKGMPRLHTLGMILDKIGLSGIVATTVTSLGCCAPALVAPYAAFLASIGLGFLTDLSVAVPILYSAVGVILLGLGLSFRRHRCPAALLLAVLGGATLLYPYHAVLEVPLFIGLVFGGQVLLLTASVLDLLLVRRWRARRGR